MGRVHGMGGSEWVYRKSEEGTFIYMLSTDRGLESQRSDTECVTNGG